MKLFDGKETPAATEPPKPSDLDLRRQGELDATEQLLRREAQRESRKESRKALTSKPPLPISTAPRDFSISPSVSPQLPSSPPVDRPECPLKKACKNPDASHYIAYRHTEVASPGSALFIQCIDCHQQIRPDAAGRHVCIRPLDPLLTTTMRPLSTSSPIPALAPGESYLVPDTLQPWLFVGNEALDQVLLGLPPGGFFVRSRSLPLPHLQHPRPLPARGQGTEWPVPLLRGTDRQPAIQVAGPDLGLTLCPGGCHA